MPHWTDDDRGIPVLTGSIESETPHDATELIWTMRADDPDKTVTLTMSGPYETISMEVSLAAIVQLLLPDLVGFVIDAKRLPFIAQHGPQYPPPGWILRDGQLHKSRQHALIESWAKAMGLTSTPFLQTIRMGDGGERLIMEWGLAPQTEEDAHGTSTDRAADAGDGPGGAGGDL